MIRGQNSRRLFMGCGRVEFDPFERFLDLSNLTNKEMAKGEKNHL